MNGNNLKLVPLLALLIALLPGHVLAHAADDPVLVGLMIDELEYRDTKSDGDLAWDAQAWVGKDLHKLWMKTEGEISTGDIDDAELQLLYSTGVATYWDFQVGVRHDLEPSPERTWAAIGFQGLLPYFFETDAALFVGGSGRMALRLKAEYELLLTQRLILTPRIELNMHSKNDAATGTGSGLSDIEAGLRLRYEIRREFAPYIGINWLQQFGNTKDYSRAAGISTSDTQILVGIRAWY